MSDSEELHLVGHACLVVAVNGKSVIASDPWLCGTAYFDSWMIDSYPDASDIALVERAPFIYVTHEHPDHLHWSSIERLRGTRTWLLPQYLGSKMATGFERHNLIIHRMPPNKWVDVGEGVSILSFPVYPSNNDTALLISTRFALIFNFNDCGLYLKMNKVAMRSLARLAGAAHRVGKKVILLASYSPACNAFDIHKGDVRLQLRSDRDYAVAIERTCDYLGADAYFCFASNVGFCRPDNAWANEFKVTYEDLKANWISKTSLNPPQSSIDLRELRIIRIRERNVEPHMLIFREAATRCERDRQFALPDEDWDKLAAKLNRLRWLFVFVYARGIGISVNGQRRRYRPLTGGYDVGGRTSMEIAFPGLALHEALEWGFMQDLGIAMISPIRLREGQPTSLGRLFFIALAYLDYGHFSSVDRFVRWGWACFRSLFRAVPPLPELGGSARKIRATVG